MAAVQMAVSSDVPVPIASIKRPSSKLADPPSGMDVPEIVMAEFAKAEFGTADRRAFGRIPDVMFAAFVVSVVADGARPDTSSAVRFTEPPSGTESPEMVIAECARAEFGTSDNRAFGRVPVVRSVALPLIATAASSTG